MSKKKDAHDHGHDCDGHDHKEHDHHDCSGHDHDAHDHDHHECDGHDHEERIITLQGEDGKSYDCHVAGVFPFEGKEYVLLQTIGEEDNEESEEELETIIMEMIEENDMATFRSIEDDAEFERVMDFVMKVAKEADEAYARGEG